MLRDIGKSMREPRLFWFALLFLFMTTTNAKPGLLSKMVTNADKCVTNDGQKSLMAVFEEVKTNWMKEKVKKDTSGLKELMEAIKEVIEKRIYTMVKWFVVYLVVLGIISITFGCLTYHGYFCKHVKSQKKLIIILTVVITLVVAITGGYFFIWKPSLYKCYKLKGEVEKFEKEIKADIKEIIDFAKGIESGVKDIIEEAADIEEEIGEDIIDAGGVIAKDVEDGVESITGKKKFEAIKKDAESAFAQIEKDVDNVAQKTQKYMEEEYETITEENSTAYLLYFMVFALIVLGIAFIWIEPSAAEESRYEIIEV